MIEQARQAIANKDYDAAIEHVTQAIEDASANDYGKALKLATQTIQRAPNDALGYSVRGEVHNNRADFDAATKDYDKALALEPTNCACLYLRGNFLFCIDDYATALRDLEKAVELSRPGKFTLAEELLVEIRELMRDDEGDDDENDDDDESDMDEDNEKKYDELIKQAEKAYMKDKDYDKATALATQAIKLNATRAEAYELRAMAYKTMGEYHASKQDFDKADDYFKACKRNFDKVVNLGSGTALIHLLRAEACFATNCYDGAIKDCDKVLEFIDVKKDSDDAAKLINIVGVLENGGHTKLIPMFIKNYYLRAMAHSFKGDGLVAMRELENAKTNLDNAFDYCRSLGNLDAISMIVELQGNVRERKREMENVLALQGLKIERKD